MRKLTGGLLCFVLVGVAMASGADWMKQLPDERSIASITLPGTHDSGAMHEPVYGTAKTQEHTIAEQLAMGVRLLDIRCKHVENRFLIYHGTVDQKLSYAQVLMEVRGFLAKHPSECVVVTVKEEGSERGSSRKFWETFDTYVAQHPERWFLGQKVPRLGEVRGKMVLLRRFMHPKRLGLDATRWPDNTTAVTENLFLQDCYRVKSPDEKWRRIGKALELAKAEVAFSKMHINYTSGYQPGMLGIPNIRKVSDSINPKLEQYFSVSGKGFYGWIGMDFATEKLVKLVYETNL